MILYFLDTEERTHKINRKSWPFEFYDVLFLRYRKEHRR